MIKNHNFMLNRILKSFFSDFWGKVPEFAIIQKIYSIFSIDCFFSFNKQILIILSLFDYIILLTTDRVIDSENICLTYWKHL